MMIMKAHPLHSQRSNVDDNGGDDDGGTENGEDGDGGENGEDDGGGGGENEDKDGSPTPLSEVTVN